MSKATHAEQTVQATPKATVIVRKGGSKKATHQEVVEVAKQVTSNVPSPEQVSPTGLTLTELAGTTPAQVTPTEAPKAPAKATPKEEAAPIKALSMRGLAHALLLQGKTNEEVTAALLEVFGPDKFPPSHQKTYAGWYRNELVRLGKLERAPRKAATPKEPKKPSAQATAMEALQKELAEMRKAMEALLKGRK